MFGGGCAPVDGEEECHSHVVVVSACFSVDANAVVADAFEFAA